MLRFEILCSLKIILISVFISGSMLSNAQCVFTEAPLGEICETAEYICGSALDGYVGKLRNENITQVFWNNLPSNPKSGVCGNAGQFDNTSWFSFTACSSTVHLRIHFYNCEHPMGNLDDTGIQTGLYSECRKTSSVACGDVAGVTSGTVDLSYDGFTPGQMVYFVLDGYANSVCEFTIEVVEGLDTTPVAPPDASSLDSGYITGLNNLSCVQIDNPITYNLAEPERTVSFNSSCTPPTTFNPADSVCYSWTVTPSLGSHFDKDISTGTSVDVIFTEPGTYTISAEANFNPFYVGSCANAASGVINSWTVVVAPPDTIVNDIIYLCLGESTTFCGQLITSDTVIICDDNPCLVEKQEFVYGASTVNNLGVQYICDGEQFIFQGTGYSIPGEYSIQDVVDCSLTYNFTIKKLIVDVDILSSTLVLDCNNNDIELISSINSNSAGTINYKWSDETGTLLGDEASVVIDKVGQYNLLITTTESGKTCSAHTEITIEADFNIPKISSSVPVIGCKELLKPNPTITVIPQTSYSHIQWITPLGTEINDELSIEVDSLNVLAGSYRLLLTGNNGCVLDTVLKVNTNFEKANILLKGDDLTCYYPNVTLTATTNIPVDSMRWSKVAPDQKFYGSHHSKVSHVITEPGVYQVDALASSSRCWNSELITIHDNQIYPNITVDSEYKWLCKTEFIEITPSISHADGIIEFGWKSSDGSILDKSDKSVLIAGAPGTYILTVLNTDNGCKGTKEIRIIEESDIPYDISFVYDDVMCYGENNGLLDISGSLGGSKPYNYYLNGEKLSVNRLENLNPGDYSIDVVDDNGCKYTESFRVYEPEILEIETDRDVEISFFEGKTLSFRTNYPDSEIESIMWMDENGQIISEDYELFYEGHEPSILTLEVVNTNGCETVVKIRIAIDNQVKFFLPNIFSPNGDGINDRLVLFKNEIPAEINRVAIYDRYGNLVFERDHYDIGATYDGWDGTFKGSLLPPGVYVLIVELTDYSGKSHLLKSDLTLIR